MLQVCLSSVSGGLPIDCLPELNSEISQELLILLAFRDQPEVPLCVFILETGEINHQSEDLPPFFLIPLREKYVLKIEMHMLTDHGEGLV